MTDEDVQTALGLFMDDGRKAEGDLLAELEENLTNALGAVRMLRQHKGRVDVEDESPKPELDILGPVAEKIAANREANTVKGSG